MTSSVEDPSLERKDVNGEEDVVDPWNVCGNSKTGIDYDKLIGK